MININAPFILALTVIIFLVVIKWIEWFLFKNGSFPVRQKKQRAGKEGNEAKAEKDTKLSAFGRKLKNLLFFGKAELKQPWYLTALLVLLMVSYHIINYFLDLEFWHFMIYVGVTTTVFAYLSIRLMLHANREFFSVGDRRKRYIRTQTAQLFLGLLVIGLITAGILLFINHKDPDPPGLKESVDWVIEPVYEAEWPEFSEGLAAVGFRGKKGFIDREGNTAIPFRYNDAGNFHDGLAAVRKDWRWGYIDHEGKVVIPFQYDDAFEFDGGVAPVKKDGKWSVIDKTGNIKFTTEYKTIYPFHEGVAKVEIQDKQYKDRVTETLIDSEGKLLLQNGYSLAGNFSEGCVLAMESKTGLSYFFNKNGEKIIQQGYFVATDFSGGVAAVGYESGAHALIDHTGAVIRSLSEDEYYNTLSCREGLVEVNNGKWDFKFGLNAKLRYGFTDVYGNVMIPVAFHFATGPSEGLVGLEVDGRWGFIENPLPAAARGIDPELWKSDRTQIAAVEGLPVYAGELESVAYSIKEGSPELTGLPLYQKAFEQIKAEKAFEKYGKIIDPETIRYQIGDTYYKMLLLPDAT